MKKQKTIEEIKEDYHLFIDIQMGKYFRNRNINEFETENEAKAVLGRIITAWNKYVASNHEKHDSLDKSGLTAWFNSIEIEFNNMPEQVSKTRNEFPPQKNDYILGKMSEKELDLIPYCYIVLNSLGYKFERMREIISGALPSELESELIQWSFKIVRLVNKAVHTKSASKSEELLDEANFMLLEKMDKTDANKTLLNLHGHLLDDFNKQKKKK